MRLTLLVIGVLLLFGVAGALPSLSDYGSTTSLKINITSAMGEQTDYQIRFNITNASGVSGYINGENVIFTNGTTRPDFYDVNLTDLADTPQPFWMENNTCTAIGCTFWGKASTISVDNSSGFKWRYGNASQDQSTQNGYTAASLYFTDYLGSSLNTTQETNTGGTVSVSNGIMTLAGTTSTDGFVRSRAQIPINYTIESRTKTDHNGTTTITEWFGFRADVPDVRMSVLQFAYNTNSNTIRNYNGASSYSAFSGWSSGTYHRISLRRNLTGVTTKIDNGLLYSNTGTYSTVAGNITTGVHDAPSKQYTDWIFVRKSLDVEPTTSSYSTSTSSIPPGASFTCTPTSTTLGTPITCTDTSTYTPTNWTYYWGDGNVTDGTQNPSYTYPFTGTFSINQTVNNTLGGSWYNRSDYITITNVTSFTQQDIYLTGQYTITFNVKSSTTNLPIANVTVVDAVSGQSYQSTNGTAFLTEPAGLIYVNFIADGYQTKQVTYVVDQDETHEVKLVPSASDPTPNTNVIYSPRLVRLRVVDNWRTPLTPVTITASYIADTLPNNDPTYLQNAFGISSTVAGLMMNSSVAMSGVTGVDGSNTFSMFPALTYNITVTNETMGVHCQQNLAPADTDYVLFCPTDAQKAAVIPLSQTLNRSYIWITEPNASFVTINASYQDPDGLTSSVLFNVTVVDNNTVIYSKNFGNPGTSLVLDNYTMPNIRGMQIKSYLAYNRSA